MSTPPVSPQPSVPRPQSRPDGEGSPEQDAAPATARAGWVLPTIITGSVLLVGAVVVLVLVILGQNGPDPIPPATTQPSASAQETQTPEETPEPTPEATATEEPTEPEDLGPLDLSITPTSSWTVDFSARFPDGAWTEIVGAGQGHDAHLNQVIALINFNQVVALDEITGDVQWEFPLGGEVTPGGCIALARDGILACPISGEEENTGYVISIELETGRELERSELLPYTPSGIQRDGDEYLIAGYVLQQWDEDFNNGLGGTPAQAHIRRGELTSIASQPQWEAIGEPTALMPSELWTATLMNDGLISTFFNEAQIVADKDTGEILWDSATSGQSPENPANAGLTTTDGYFVSQDRQVAVYERDNTLRFERAITGWSAQYVGEDIMLAGSGGYNAQTGELIYEFEAPYTTYSVGNGLGIGVAPFSTIFFDINLGAVLWQPGFVFDSGSDYWATGDDYLTSVHEARRLAAYDMRTGTQHWNIQLTSEELTQPLGPLMHYPTRTAHAYSWVAGEQGDTIHNIVLGGYGQGWSLTNQPD